MCSDINIIEAPSADSAPDQNTTFCVSRQLPVMLSILSVSYWTAILPVCTLQLDVAYMHCSAFAATTVNVPSLSVNQAGCNIGTKFMYPSIALTLYVAFLILCSNPCSTLSCTVFG